MKRAWLAVLAGCGRLHFDAVGGGGTADAAAATGDAVDAQLVLGTWGSPTQLALGAGAFDDPSQTGDGLELYVNCGVRICQTDRATTNDTWPTATPLSSLPTTQLYSPHISYDGLTLWLTQVTTVAQIYVTTRTARTDSWGPVQAIAELASTSNDDGPAVTSDGLVMVFDTDRDGTAGLYMTSRPTVTSTWGAPMPIDTGTANIGQRPHLTDDRLTLYFQRQNDIWTAHRTSAIATFDAPVPLTEVNTSSLEADPWVSPDQRTLLLVSDQTGISQIWRWTR